MPLEQLQWWLYAIQFESQIESHLSEEQIQSIEVFKKGMEGLRKKMAEMSGVNSKENQSVEDSFNFNKSMTNDQNIKTYNLITVLTNVKKEVNEIAKQDKVSMYQKVLL